MTATLAAKWNAIYQETSTEPRPAEVLKQHLYLLPESGHCLDLACGLGGNALLLAHAGLSVDAWDISSVALQKLELQAALQGFLAIQCRQVALHAHCLPSQHYDVIVVSRFLDRTLTDAIMASLKPGGLLFYQTYTRHKLDHSGPSNPNYLLARNELLQLFSPLNIIYYQEYPAIGNLHFGNRNEAMLIARNPYLELNS